MYLSPEDNKKLRVIFIVEFIQYSDVLTVDHQPVNGEEMVPMSKLLVQCPKYL